MQWKISNVTMTMTRARFQMLSTCLERSRVANPLNHADGTSHGNDFVRPYLQAPFRSGGGSRQNAIHHHEQLLNALIQPEIFPALEGRRMQNSHCNKSKYSRATSKLTP
jgi:hypothetical protein